MAICRLLLMSRPIHKPLRRLMDLLRQIAAVVMIPADAIRVMMEDGEPVPDHLVLDVSLRPIHPIHPFIYSSHPITPSDEVVPDVFWMDDG